MHNRTTYMMKWYRNMTVHIYIKTKEEILKSFDQCRTCWNVWRVSLSWLCTISTYLGSFFCPITWGSRIYQLHLYSPPTSNVCPGYDTKQSDSEVTGMLELWGMQSTLSLPSLLGPLWPGMVASDGEISMGQIELNCVLMLNWIALNRTVLRINCV